MSCSWPGVAAMSWAIDGSATITMKKSSTTMNAPARITSKRALSSSVIRVAARAVEASTAPPVAAAPNLFVACVTRTSGRGIVPTPTGGVYAQLLIWRKRVCADITAVSVIGEPPLHGKPAHRLAVGMVLARELHELVERHRAPVGIALHHVATDALEDLHVGSLFDPLGDHAELQ